MSTRKGVSRTRPVGDDADAKPVGIWIRVSTEDQAKGDSPEHHEHRARAYAEARDWRVREVYHLEAVSGKSVMDHPEAERMMGHVRSGHITGLIFSKLARLGRNTRELLHFADFFREHEAALVSLQEAFDTSTAAGRLFYTFVAAMAEWERAEISERTAASVPIRAKLGKPIGGVPPFGYRWEGRQLIPDPQEAPIRKLMYELFLEHRRKKTVAETLNARGFRTRKGAPFTDTTVHRLLLDPTAKGVRRANYTRAAGNGRVVKKPEAEWVLTAVEPIVSEELWTEVNAILAEQHRVVEKRPPKRAVHLFAGVLFCTCGEKMYKRSARTTYICEACRTKIAEGDLEAVFHEQLRGFLVSPDEIAGYLAQADEVLQAKTETLQSLDAEHERVRAEMAKLYRLYQGDNISPDGFGRSYRPLEERLHQLEDELPRLQGEVDYLTVQHASRDDVLAGAQDLFDRWPELASEEKRLVVENLVEKIVIGTSEVEIQLSYMPPASEIATKGQRTLRGSRCPTSRREAGKDRDRG